MATTNNLLLIIISPLGSVIEGSGSTKPPNSAIHGVAETSSIALSPNPIRAK